MTPFGSVESGDVFMRVMLSTMGHLLTAQVLGIRPEQLLMTGD